MKTRFEPTVGQRPVNYSVSVLRAEEVKVTAGVAGDDELENIGKCAANRREIAGEGGIGFPGVTSVETTP